MQDTGGKSDSLFLAISVNHSFERTAKRWNARLRSRKDDIMVVCIYNSSRVLLTEDAEAATLPHTAGSAMLPCCNGVL